MITTFLIQQHEKQIKILDLINDLKLRISSHKAYLKHTPEWNKKSTDHLNYRIATDIEIVKRLQSSYIRISRETVEKIMDHESQNNAVEFAERILNPAA